MLGEGIRARRKELKLEQAELARRVGVSAQAIWRIEKGDVQNPRLDLLKAIARELAVSVDDLLSDKKRNSRPASAH
jgi:transcriptional regulator with XRE-family HTH domain